ncbi:hypothetical protein RHGRI_037327 [Rhododendron griersonianum]|uniref:Uncharacterized protein n=1 Tax=Rhododendron griersonianum TaxID=479676 RepID=A0AAV6HRU5_9ERIC|nr:hypothetical protein RHGRI_037327 [Rhododendron griersonianum]
MTQVFRRRGSASLGRDGFRSTRRRDILRELLLLLSQLLWVRSISTPPRVRGFCGDGWSRNVSPRHLLGRRTAVFFVRTASPRPPLPLHALGRKLPLYRELAGLEEEVGWENNWAF